MKSLPVLVTMIVLLAATAARSADPAFTSLDGATFGMSVQDAIDKIGTRHKVSKYTDRIRGEEHLEFDVQDIDNTKFLVDFPGGGLERFLGTKSYSKMTEEQCNSKVMKLAEFLKIAADQHRYVFSPQVGRYGGITQCSIYCFADDVHASFVSDFDPRDGACDVILSIRRNQSCQSASAEYLRINGMGPEKVSEK